MNSENLVSGTEDQQPTKYLKVRVVEKAQNRIIPAQDSGFAANEIADQNADNNNDDNEDESNTQAQHLHESSGPIRVRARLVGEVEDKPDHSPEQAINSSPEPVTKSSPEPIAEVWSAESGALQEAKTADLAKTDGARPEVQGGFVYRVYSWICGAIENVFGLVTIIVCLSALAVFPLLQFISLGYFFAAGAAVAASGRLRDGLLLLKPAARLGSMIVGAWLTMLPLRIYAIYYQNSLILNPDGATTQRIETTLQALTTLALIHIFLAILAGGKLRHFAWPPGNIKAAFKRLQAGQYLGTLRDQFWSAVDQLEVWKYFFLGFRGFVGTFLWLAIPTTMIAAAGKRPGLAFIGGLLLAWVATVLPFLQVRFATEDRFRAFFELSAARAVFRKAPISAVFTVMLALLLPIPLYLLKIELIASEAGWMPNLLFIGLILPAKLCAGWCYYRAQAKPEDSYLIVRFLFKPLLLPLALTYALFVFFSQFTAWEGVASLYSQHAFLLPVPFGKFGDF